MANSNIRRIKIIFRAMSGLKLPEREFQELTRELEALLKDKGFAVKIEEIKEEENG